MNDLIDAVMPVDPEPCETCTTGIRYIMSWDSVGRCRNCVMDYARKMGWDQRELSSDAVDKAERMSKRTLLADPELEWNPRSRKDPQVLPRPTADPELGS